MGGGGFTDSRCSPYQRLHGNLRRTVHGLPLNFFHPACRLSGLTPPSQAIWVLAGEQLTLLPASPFMPDRIAQPQNTLLRALQANATQKLKGRELS